MKFQFENSIAPGQSVTFEQRHSIYLFCNEAVNNIVKYSEGSLLHLSINQTDKYLEYVVSDNGKGFDCDQIKKGNGLKNMHQRANDIDAIYHIDTAPGKGCTISLQIRHI